MRILNRLIRDAKASVIVESAIVFPVMFFTIAFLIFLGNLMHEKARVDSIVMAFAVEGAKYCADPFYEYVATTGYLPEDFKDYNDIQPYRYLFGIDKSIETEVEKRVVEEISGKHKSFFKVQDSSVTAKAKYDQGLISSTFKVEVTYKYTLPFSFANMSLPSIMEVNSKAEVAVDDCDEFIRNTDMAIDYVNKFLKETETGKKVSEFIQGSLSKVKDFFNRFGKK